MSNLKALNRDILETVILPGFASWPACDACYSSAAPSTRATTKTTLPVTTTTPSTSIPLRQRTERAHPVIISSIQSDMFGRYFPPYIFCM